MTRWSRPLGRATGLLLAGCAAFAAFATFAAAGENLVKNPGFEEVDANGRPNHWRFGHMGGLDENAGGASAEAAYAGERGCFVVKPGGPRLSALVQTVAIEPNKYYCLSGMARGKGELLGYLRDGDGGYIGNRGQSPFDSDTWLKLKNAFNSGPNGGFFEIHFEICCENAWGEGFLDDVSLEEIAAPPPGLVTGLAADFDADSRAVTLSWDRPAGGNDEWRHQILRSLNYPENVTVWNEPVAVVETNSFADTLPEGAERVYYSVRAVDEYTRVGDPCPAVAAPPPPAASSGRPVVWTDSVLAKARRYAPIPADPPAPVLAFELAGNETESAQILVAALDGAVDGLDIRFKPWRAKDGKSEDPEARLSATILETRYTMVARPTIAGQTPGLYGDPLPPWRGAVDVPAGATQSIWVQVAAAPDCPPGEYEAEALITTKQGARVIVPATARVRAFSLPLAASFRSSFGIFGNGVAEAHGLERFGPGYNERMEQYYNFLLDRRLTPRDLPYPFESPEAERFINDPRVTAFNIVPPGGPHRENVYTLTRAINILRKKGWLDKAFIYSMDEPEGGQYGYIKDFVVRLRNLAGADVPPFLLTLNNAYGPDLAGTVDIWTPILSGCDWPLLRGRQAAGDELWWYTCINPQGAYPTYLIDSSGVANRVLSWLQVLEKVEGVLYWDTDYWRHPGLHDGLAVWETAEIYPKANGDGFLMYPGPPVGIDGPVTSQRLEIIRDGNEDVEYFAILRRRLAAGGMSDADIDERVRELIQPLARELTDWTDSPEVLLEQRRLLADAIESLPG